MARITVPFSGLTSHPNHKDGECSNLVNLRPKNGYLKPVPPRKTIDTLDKEYDIVFVHRVSGESIWLGVVNDTPYSTGKVYAYINKPSEIIEISKKFGLPDIYLNIRSIQQVGNTLSLVTDKGLRYVLWDGENYKFLGALPDIPLIEMGVFPAVYTHEATYKSVLGKEWMLPLKAIRDASWDEYLKEYKVINTAMLNACREKLVNGDSPSTSEGVKLFDAHIVRWAFRLYDGSVVKHSAPLLVMPNVDISWLNLFLVNWAVSGNKVESDSSYVRVSAYDFSMMYNLAELSPWSDIITSVDVFLSPPLGLTSEEYVSDFHYKYNQAGVQVPVEMFKPVSTFQIDRIKSTSNLYLSHSLKLINSTQSFCDTMSSQIKDISSIISQELMPVDSLSHHSFTASHASVYNNRLRLSDITTTLFNGFDPRFFNWKSAFNGVDNVSFSSNQYFHIFTYIKTIDGVKIVGRAISSDFANSLVINPFISYPDPRAYKMVFGLSDDYKSYSIIRVILSVNLEAHSGLNIAYAINSNLKPFSINPINSTPSLSMPTFNKTLHEPNKLKVSEVNNPFMFPNQNTYQIGSGKILAESSIVMNVTDRNYGMYPVFVFTTDGVFTMAGQTPDTVHNSIQAPTYLEPPISNVICATPYGVVFVTNRGLMMISQHETIFLSPQLRDKDNRLRLSDDTGSPLEFLKDIHGNTVLSTMAMHTVSSEHIPFNRFVKNAKHMLYVPHEDELIISSSETDDYCYVYNFPSKTFYLYTEKITGVAQNTFPDVFTIDGASVKDFSEYGSPRANVSFITRPLSFGTTDIKTLHRAWLRTTAFEANPLRLILLHSMDGYDYSPAKGFEIVHAGSRPPQNYLDFDFGMLARETYRQYLVLLDGKIHMDSEIRYLDFEVAKRYNNDKMR